MYSAFDIKSGDIKRCKVCGDEATDHLNYGGVSCSSCREFFRRSSIKLEDFPSFVFPCKCKESCIELGTILCKISKSNRKHCKHCRYQKCLNLAGMKMKLAVDDKRQLGWMQSVSQETNLSKSNVPIEQPIRDYTSPTYSTLPNIASRLCPMERISTINCRNDNYDDVLCTMRCVNSIVDNYDNSVKSVALGERILRQCLFSSIFKVPLSSESSELFFRLVLQRSKCVAKASADFMCLSSRLQNILLRNNISSIAIIRFAAIDNINDPEEMMKKSMGPTDFQIATSLRHQVLNSSTSIPFDAGTLGFKFRNIHECFINGPSEERHQYLRSMIRSKIGSDLKLATLITYAALFSYDANTDYLGDSEKQVIEKMKENSILVIKRYLYLLYPSNNASMKLDHVLEMLEALKTTSKMLKPLDEQ